MKIVFLINLKMNFNVETRIVCRINGLFQKNMALLKIRANSFLLIEMNLKIKIAICKKRIDMARYR